ncbi:MAG: molybdopterin-guanine dinucleotide biosynthesis protein B [Chloroflexi bacterium]|nr:molybdopterin-guanine dinucleotide biosynthesis protein B [Chloroflexota bacterium]
MIPIISVVGRSEVGKTTLLEKLIAELKGRGYRVAAVKHDVHGFELDKPGKDSWRLAQAGSDAVVLSSPEKMALIKNVDHDLALQEIGYLLGREFDIILTEGYKQSRGTKIEVHRKGMGELLCAPGELLAVATDESLDTPVPQFSLEDAKGLANLVVDFMAQRQDEDITLVYVNGKPVPIKSFVEEIISVAILGMVSTLNGVGEVGRLDITIQRKKKHGVSGG